MSFVYSTIATVRGEGYPSVITLGTNQLDRSEEVRFRGNADIDADGANGQHGRRFAYTPNNTGADFLANIGYPRSPGEYRVGLVCDQAGLPIVFVDAGTSKRYYASRTALRMPGITDQSSPSIGVDSDFYPYIVVPAIVRQRTAGTVLGCQAFVVNHKNTRVVKCVVADIGPSNKDGELSMEAAHQLGIISDPKTGGMDDPDCDYIIQPGVRAIVLDGSGAEFTFSLQAA